MILLNYVFDSIKLILCNAAFLKLLDLSQLTLQVPFRMQNPFSLLKNGKSKSHLSPPLSIYGLSNVKTFDSVDGVSNVKTFDSVSFPLVIGQKRSLKATGQTYGRVKVKSHSDKKCFKVRNQCHSLDSSSFRNKLEEPTMKGTKWLHTAPDRDLDGVLSLHTQVHNLKYMERQCLGEWNSLDPNMQSLSTSIFILS